MIVRPRSSSFVLVRAFFRPVRPRSSTSVRSFVPVRPRTSSYMHSFVPVRHRLRPSPSPSPSVTVSVRRCSVPHIWDVSMLVWPCTTLPSPTMAPHRLRPSPAIVVRHLTYDRFHGEFCRVRPFPDPLWSVTVSVRLRPSLLVTTDMTVSMGSFAVARLRIS